MDHPKFQALNGNAISLWWEGKNYCDRFLTDGLIPAETARRFRFGGKKSIEMLTTAIALPKPDGSRYAPLWERHDLGYKMHDFLDHNDCREAVLARMEQADERRVSDRERLKRWRAAKKNKTETPLETPNETDMKRAANVSETLSTETATATETRVRTDAPPFRMAPLHDNSHRKHAHCGRVCLPASLFSEFVRRRNHPDADKELREWAMTVEREWESPEKSRLEPGDAFEFWKARYAERWPATAIVGKAKWGGWRPSEAAR